MRAYNTPEGTCVVLGDFLTTLDVPMRIDLAGKKASGWAFKENNKISIDYGGDDASLMAARPSRSRPARSAKRPKAGASRPRRLARWFGIGVKPVTAGSVLVLAVRGQAAGRARDRAPAARGSTSSPASFDLASLPQVRLPYRMWRAPALDFVVSAGVTYRASDGVRVDRQSSVYAAGEIAHLSYDAQLTTTPKGMPSMLRLRAYRSDPDGHLLGPAQGDPFRLRRCRGLRQPA